MNMKYNLIKAKIHTDTKERVDKNLYQRIQSQEHLYKTLKYHNSN